MRQIVIPRNGPPEVLKIEEVSDPQPGENEVLIRVKAAGLNFADVLARQGIYPDAPPKPCVVGYEVAGIVEQTGGQVENVIVGQEVIAMTRFKGQAEKVVVPALACFPKPFSLSSEQAAALPVNYLTAWGLLVVMGSLHAGETVLIHNAGGGVGLAALDIARHIGARTIGTASAWKHEFLKQRGMDEVIDYRQEDWFPRLMELTDGRGVELIIDPIGGSHWKKSYKALRTTGRLGMFGISSAASTGMGAKFRMIKTALQIPWFHPLSLLDKNRAVFGLNLGHFWHEAEKVTGWTAALLKGVEEGWVKPHVDKTFSFQSAAEAHRYLEERKNIGKVILVP